MRPLFSPEVERARVCDNAHNRAMFGPAGESFLSEPGDDFGLFFFRRKGILLKVIASGGTEEIPWEHVSASTKVRCPTWEEMAWLKELFFEEHEAVMQLHPPKKDYVNYHPFCLHLWRPKNAEIPLPPSIAVGPVGKTMTRSP